jgi:hypothetical protein
VLTPAFCNGTVSRAAQLEGVNMRGVFEGDLVRPLGFVTLYAAYAEGEIDELLSVLPATEPFDDSRRRWQVGRKLLYSRALVRKLRVDDLSGLLNILEEGRSLFDQRNELVHGRLFAGGRLVSNRLSAGERFVSVEGITALAEQLSNWKERLWMHRCRYLLPLLRTQTGNDAKSGARPNVRRSARSR